jgi:RimJ/RimL family protein N-acetyltransferase
MTEASRYPTELEAQFTLSDHRRVRIRALHAHEADPIRALYARLSPRTRYLRFLSPMPALPDSVVRHLASVDHQRRLAIVAEDDGAGRDGVIALASFGAIDDATAEVSVVVRDDWQGQGVGTALVAALLNAAEARGFRRFVANIVSENSIIRKLIDRVGRIVASRTSLGVSELAFVRRRS